MVDDSNPTTQNDDWLKELQLIREEAKAEQREKQAEREAKAAQLKSTVDLLKQVNGLEFLRDIQKNVLNGQGLLEQLDDTGKYERALALRWDGPMAAPTRPKDEGQAQHGILIGVAKNQLFVNENLVSPATSQALQKSLLQLLRNLDKPQQAEAKPQQKAPPSKDTFTKLKWAIILSLLFIIFVLVALGIILLMNTGLFTSLMW